MIVRRPAAVARRHRRAGVAGTTTRTPLAASGSAHSVPPLNRLVSPDIRCVRHTSRLSRRLSTAVVNHHTPPAILLWGNTAESSSVGVVGARKRRRFVRGSRSAVDNTPRIRTPRHDYFRDQRAGNGSTTAATCAGTSPRIISRQWVQCMYKRSRSWKARESTSDCQQN